MELAEQKPAKFMQTSKICIRNNKDLDDTSSSRFFYLKELFIFEFPSILLETVKLPTDEAQALVIPGGRVSLR